ncbi:MAG: type III pantothenate kinase [bacterium]
MWIVIDIGNTNIVAGAYEDTRLIETARFTTPFSLTPDEAHELLCRRMRKTVGNGVTDLRGVIGSVVPKLTEPFKSACTKETGVEPLVVSHECRLPITIDVDQPHQVGADRIANAAAAYAITKGPAIVVDFGTATTFDVVTAAGAYIGGVILPGPHTAMADLARRAAKLFEVAIEPPERVVGRTTEAALRSGMFYGTVGQVDSIIERIMAETGRADYTVLATGGLAGKIEQHSTRVASVVPHLTLDGLRIIGRLNQAVHP